MGWLVSVAVLQSPADVQELIFTWQHPSLAPDHFQEYPGIHIWPELVVPQSHLISATKCCFLIEFLNAFG